MKHPHFFSISATVATASLLAACSLQSPTRTANAAFASSEVEPACVDLQVPVDTTTDDPQWMACGGHVCSTSVNDVRGYVFGDPATGQVVLLKDDVRLDSNRCRARIGAAPMKPVAEAAEAKDAEALAGGGGGLPATSTEPPRSMPPLPPPPPPLVAAPAMTQPTQDACIGIFRMRCSAPYDLMGPCLGARACP
jgi:hypothetical protein